MDRAGMRAGKSPTDGQPDLEQAWALGFSTQAGLRYLNLACLIDGAGHELSC